MSSTTVHTARKIATFVVGHRRLGFDVHAINEVIDNPSVLTENPQVDSPVKGVFSWRGKLLPILDGAMALGAHSQPDVRRLEGKVVVLTNGLSAAGMLVESIGDVVTVTEEQLRNPPGRADSESSIVDAIATLHEGSEGIEIANAVALFRLPELTPTHAAGLVAPSAEEVSIHDQGRPHITFEAGGVAYALDVSLVVEVAYLAELVESFLVSTKCIGMMPYRGGQLPLVPLDALLRDSAQRQARTAASRVLIIACGGETLGLVVDATHGIEYFTAAKISEPPAEAAEQRGCRGTASGLDAVERRVLNPEFILANAELGAIAQGYATIYRRAPRKHSLQATHHRKYYLLFKLQELLAVEMLELDEIIDLPGEFVCPPGLPDYVMGIHSLRDAAVTLLDGRQVYGLPVRTLEVDSGRPKALICGHGDFKLGLVVDSVDRIVAADVHSVIPIPRSVMGRLSPDFEGDVKDFIEVSDFSSRQTLKFIVLEFSRVFARLRVA